MGEDSTYIGDFEIVNDQNTVVLRVSENGNVYVGGVLTHSSDQYRKENLLYLNTRMILDQLSSMPIYRWNFQEDSNTPVGPMAQDFL